ncbi:MAG: endonuclease III, partial [Rhodospirillaceae bacterium]
MTRILIEDFFARLAERNPEPKTELESVNAYTLLVAVVLSAQCTDKKVNQVTPALFALAGDPHALAALPATTVQAIIQPLGLAPQKAKALVGLSRRIVAEHDGCVPAT